MSLPSAYQEVEYIQSSWTQWIDTWYWNSNWVYVDMELEYTSTPSTRVIFWAEVWSWASQRLYVWATTKHSIWSSTAEANWWSVQANTRYVYNASFVAWTWASLYVNNTLTASTSTTWYSSANLFVFAWNLRWSAAALWYMKLYYLKIYTPDKSTLVRDFVPCYRKSDGVIWLYDLVNDTFYTNSWTWTFTKWPDVIVEWYVISRILWWWPANDGTATNKQRLIWGTEPTPPTPPALFEIETDFRNYSNISDVYALWWWAWAKWSMQPAVNTSYWFYCSNYSSAWWWCWLYYNISSYMSNAKKITMNLTWTLPAATYQGNESLFLTDTTVLDSTGSDTAPNRLYTSIKWWPYNDVTCIWKRLNWTWSKLYEYWSSTYNWDTDMTWEINLETWVITCTFIQPASISMTYTLTSSELSWVKSTLKYAAFNFTTYTTWLNDTIKTAHLKIE